MSYIFYGAGAYAEENLDRLVLEGYKPACFVDADKKKRNKKFRNSELMVLSIEDAMLTYPDYKYILTVNENFYIEVYNYLIGLGVNSNQIFFTEKVEYRKGCNLFESTLVVDARDIRICCSPLTNNRDFFSFLMNVIRN